MRSFDELRLEVFVMELEKALNVRTAGWFIVDYAMIPAILNLSLFQRFYQVGR